MYILVRKGVKTPVSLPFTLYFDKKDEDSKPVFTVSAFSVFEQGGQNVIKVATLDPTVIKQNGWAFEFILNGDEFASLRPNPIREDKLRTFVLEASDAKGNPLLLTGNFYLEVIGA